MIRFNLIQQDRISAQSRVHSTILRNNSAYYILGYNGLLIMSPLEH